MKPIKYIEGHPTGPEFDLVYHLKYFYTIRYFHQRPYAKLASYLCYMSL